MPGHRSVEPARKPARLLSRGVFEGLLHGGIVGFRPDRGILELARVAGQLIHGLHHQAAPADRKTPVTAQPIEGSGRGLAGSAYQTSNISLRKMELHPADRGGGVGFAPTQQQASDTLLNFKECDPLHLLFKIPYTAAKVPRIRLPEFRVRLGES